MPGATANLALPYPLGTDPVDPAGDIQRLAEALDTEGITRVGYSGYMTGQSVPVAVDTWLTWANTFIDEPVGHLTSPNTVTIQEEGYYNVQMRYQWTGPFGQVIIPGLWIQGIKYSGPGNDGASGSLSMITGLGPGYTVGATLYNANTGPITVSADISVIRVQR